MSSKAVHRALLVAALTSAAGLGMSCLKLEIDSGFKCASVDAGGKRCPPPYECREPQQTCWLPGEDASVDGPSGSVGTGGSSAGRGGGAGTLGIAGTGGNTSPGGAGGGGSPGGTAGSGGGAGTTPSGGASGRGGGAGGNTGGVVGVAGTTGPGSAGTSAAGSGGASGKGGTVGTAGSGASGRGGSSAGTNGAAGTGAVAGRGGSAGTGTAGSTGGTVATGGRGGTGTAGTSAGGAGGTVSLKPIGSICGTSLECVSGATCVEGICCNSACAAKCMSCRATNTNAAEGTCAPVKAGTTHNTDCAAAPASTCSFDGTCDGAGACRKHGPSTICKDPSCLQGAATFTAASTCDGNGDCVAGSSSSCANYTCNASSAMCRTSCSGASDCISTAYCAGTTCTLKKSAGALCSGNAECMTGSCGGRCCNAGPTCTCPQPTPANLVKNPGFDTDLSNWTIVAGDGEVVFAANDADSCPFSGSAFVSLTVGPTSPRISQCISVSPPQSAPSTTYYFGYRIRSSTGGGVGCDLDEFASPNCTGSPTQVVSGEDSVWINVSWSPMNTSGVQIGSNAGSVRVSCYLPSANGLYLDRVYFGVTSGPY